MAHLPAPPRRALLAAPVVLIATTYVAFNGFAAWLGPRTGYLLGFLFFWIVWCLLVPLACFGARGVLDMFRPAVPRAGRPAWLGWLLLAVPVVVAYAYAFPRALPHATVPIVLLSALIALVNGTLEEVFWRGTFVRAFPDDAIRGWLYPSACFGVWHVAPQSVASGMGNPGGAVAFVAVAFAFGLCWGWVALRTGSIRWTAVSHVLMNFAGLGAIVYLR